jgi:hypothetical protein
MAHENGRTWPGVVATCDEGDQQDVLEILAYPAETCPGADDANRRTGWIAAVETLSSIVEALGEGLGASKCI